MSFYTYIAKIGYVDIISPYILSPPCLDISLKWKLTGWAIGRVMGRLAVNYYNRDLSALEPAIEPFL